MNWHLLGTIVQAGAFLAIPALIIWWERRSKLIQTVSPVVVCYSVGIALANTPGVELNRGLTSTTTEAAVLLAIPLLLMSCDMRRWWRLAPKTAISFGLAIVAIVIASTLGALLFASQVDGAGQVAGMLVGVYTGGTPNMTAIAMALDVPESTFILVNSADMLLGSVYLLFLMTVAKPVLARVLPPFRFMDRSEAEYALADPNPGAHMNWRGAALGTLTSLMISVFGVSLSLLMPGEPNATLVILTVTSLAIVSTFFAPLRRLGSTYETGQYLMLVFCLAIGTLADANELIAALSTVFLYVATVMFTAILLHFGFCVLLRIDVDTTIITSTAAVFGPPFVGPIANVLGNREIVVSGVAAGVIGLAIGNYLGVAVTMALG